ncbi:MAG: 16S rRNA (cytosine(1402)-N(4))-methyltransferase [Gammaproteobacteria bacterium RBG_16_51_14]|nr:MAG: 16S rRNA (cytosine(1402)-N(4))-methyltransferase [Gammaproteobacteria bacterium RBG_16_51_14]
MSNVGCGHIPVLLNEVLNGLNLQPAGSYIDCTFGRGGHSEAILQYLGEQGRLLAIDKDPDAIRSAGSHLVSDPRFQLVQGTFSELDHLLAENEMGTKIDGVLFDLGVSSPQFDNPGRGFSFQRDGVLDMRMNTGNEDLTAADWLNCAREDDIADVLFRYGEERYARRIAGKIVRERVHNPIYSTVQLADLVKSVCPIGKKGEKHPATKTFQAIRIFINRELDELEKALPQVINILKPGGRLVVISFHSLEDRIVKRFIRNESRGNQYPPEVPVTQELMCPRLKSVGKAIRPTLNEVERNPRARSAVLRIAERCSA